jgi:hypothetical protein
MTTLDQSDMLSNLRILAVFVIVNTTNITQFGNLTPHSISP